MADQSVYELEVKQMVPPKTRRKHSVKAEGTTPAVSASPESDARSAKITAGKAKAKTKGRAAGAVKSASAGPGETSTISTPSKSAESKAKAGTRKTKAGTRKTKAGTRKAKAGTRKTKAGTSKTKADTVRTPAETATEQAFVPGGVALDQPVPKGGEPEGPFTIQPLFGDRPDGVLSASFCVHETPRSIVKLALVSGHPGNLKKK